MLRSVMLGLFLALCCFLSELVLSAKALADGSRPSLVKILSTPKGYQLTRNGEPYFIKGGGGSGHLKLLARIGGNSIRTWGTEGLQEILDDAHKNGLTVSVGIWLGHERHGFNYNDADQVAAQYEMAREAILRFKDHPAVLIWGIGNEMEGPSNGKADNAAIWSAINNIASLAKRLDPNHPTMTVVAELAGDRVKNIHRLCPDIDLIGINSYGEASTVPTRYRDLGGKKPYILTEFGPPGTWELPRNTWNAVPELTSTAKGEVYRKVYRDAVLAAPDLCLGSYAFIWGNKHESTATWFGVLLPDGRRLAAADALQELWSGKAPTQPCPRLESLQLQGPDKVEPGATIKARLKTSAPDAGKLQVRWVLQADPAIQGTGGDREDVPPTFPEAIVKGDLEGVEVRMPGNGGGYRLYAYVRDEGDGAAVANIPLYVNGPIIIARAPKAELPLILYDEADRKTPPYLPTGFMGNIKALRVDSACKDNPHQGKTCLSITYADQDNWSGVVWQHPGNNWGDRAGGWDLTGATRLTFWARGSTGGEVVAFEYGILGKDKKFPDSGGDKLKGIKLTPEWKQYTLELGNRDLSRIQTGFACIIAGQGKPMAIYLDDIRYE